MLTELVGGYKDVNTDILGSKRVLKHDLGLTVHEPVRYIVFRVP